MSEQLQLRRNTATNIASFTGAQGEVVIDTTNNRIVVQDGSTAGGYAAAKLSEVVVNTSLPLTLASGTHGASIQFGLLEFVCSPLSGTTYTAPTQIPANALVFAVGVYVTATITGATSFEVGDPGSLSRYGSGLGLTAGSSNYGLISPNPYYSATNILLTAAGSAFTAGAVRLSIHYMISTPSTS